MYPPPQFERPYVDTNEPRAKTIHVRYRSAHAEAMPVAVDAAAVMVLGMIEELKIPSHRLLFRFDPLGP
jgi:hypothetical protein